MALSDGKLLGSWSVTPSAVFQARYINGKFYGTQLAPELGVGAFLIRDRKFFKNTGISGTFTTASDITTGDLDLLETSTTSGSDNYGLTLTNETNFIGYIKKQSGVNVYFISAADLESDKDGDGVLDSTVRSANPVTQVWEWYTSQSPVVMIGIALAAFFVVKSFMAPKGRKKGFLASIFA